MTDLPTILRLLTPCARCHQAPADPDGFYPELCPTCNEIEYGRELAPEVED